MVALIYHLLTYLHTYLHHQATLSNAARTHKTNQYIITQ